VKQSGPNVAATVTVHHLILTLDDIIGDSLKPQNFCKPIPKHGLDKKAIREAVFSGNPKFFLGTDSAPHSFEKKACLCGAAGVYSAPVAIPILIEEFEKKNKLHLLSYFTSLYGSYFYHVPCPTEMVTYVKEDWVVPDSVDGAVPLIAGGTLKWKLAH
jgi:dihydroorotase